jgi:hypothetical protein
MNADLTEKFIQHLALGGQPVAPADGGIFLTRHALARKAAEI